MTKAMDEPLKKAVEEWLKDISYADDPDYIPSDFALDFVIFIKLVNGDRGEENETPAVHYRMLDQLPTKMQNILNMCARGLAKSAIFGEYLILYIAVYGGIPVFGDISYLLYVSDSIENGVKKMRLRLENRIENSDFLKAYLPERRFTDIRWYFVNKEGKKTVVTGHGAKALSLDSTLYTDQGVTTIGECQIGDQIFGADGNLTTIVAKSEIFNKPMYEIGLMDGRKIKVSEDHINSVVQKNYTRPTITYVKKNLTTKELLETKLYNVRKRSNPQQHWKRTVTENLLFIENCSPLQYSTKYQPIDPYTLGLLLGDGSLRSDSVVLHGHKDDFPEYREAIPYKLGKIQIDKRNTNVISQAVKGLTQKIRDLDLVGHGDYKFIPTVYLTGDADQRLALLQGLMDTDGTISARKINPVSSFTSNSKLLVRGVATLVRSLGGVVSFGKTGDKAFRIQVKLNLPVFKLARKHNKEKYNRCTRVGIKHIKPIEDEPSQCIAVDNEEKQFITTDHTRTHNTGVRGTVELNTRPQLAILDDLVSDDDAKSATIIESIENTVYRAVQFALHPAKNKIVWSGTPFNAKDPLYKAVESGAWYVNVFPVCEQFPCSEEEFKSAWPDRFPYSYVKASYDKAIKSGKVSDFNQELMLRIMSDEERLIRDTDIMWYEFAKVRENLHRYNIYITTDFATTDKTAGDYSVIAVWALDYKGNWFWIDGIVKKQLMDKNIDDLFRLAQEYRVNLQSVGIEISGQQKGFIRWVQGEMLSRGIMFNLASDNKSGDPGIAPNTNKMQRFSVVVPWFKMKQIWFPEEKRLDPEIVEYMDELTLAAIGKFKSKYDDCIDSISQLASLKTWRPSEEVDMKQNDLTGIWQVEEEAYTPSSISTYIV